MSNEPDTTTPRRIDWAGIAGSSVFAMIGSYVFITSLSLSPMAAIFPRTIGAVMVVLCAIQIATALAGNSGRSVEQTGSGAERMDGLGRRLTLIATMLGWAMLFPLVGVFFTSLVAAVILMATGQFGRLTSVRLAIYLVALIIMVGGFYMLMTEVLNIPMPRGLFF